MLIGQMDWRKGIIALAEPLKMDINGAVFKSRWKKNEELIRRVKRGAVFGEYHSRMDQ